MTIKRVAFIGLGAMGFPMARHLLEGGYKLNIVHHSRRKASMDRVEKLASMGADVVEDINQIGKDADLIISILPTDKEIREVFLDQDFIENVEENTIIMDMTSCPAQVLEELEEVYSKKSVTVLDGPVSGGVKGAEKGSLTIFGSGDKEALDKIEPVLKSFGKNIYHIGKLGAGKTLKSINQMMIAINTLGVIEGFNLAKEKGIDFSIMKEVISKSSGSSYALVNYTDRLANEDFEAGFKLTLMKKDLKVALDSMDQMASPLSDLVHNLLTMADQYRDMDFSAVSKLYKQN